MFRKLLKSIEYHHKMHEYWKTVTEEQAREDGQLAWTIDSTESDSYWSGKPFEEYRLFELECCELRHKEDREELEKFRKCGFEI